MPNTLEAAALQMAAGTLPRAMAVYAIDDDTADGKTPRYRKPSPRSAGIHCGAIPLRPFMGRTTNGKNTKVRAVITIWRRQ